MYCYILAHCLLICFIISLINLMLPYWHRHAAPFWSATLISWQLSPFCNVFQFLHRSGPWPQPWAVIECFVYTLSTSRMVELFWISWEHSKQLFRFLNFCVSIDKCWLCVEFEFLPLSLSASHHIRHGLKFFKSMFIASFASRDSVLLLTSCFGTTWTCGLFEHVCKSSGNCIRYRMRMCCRIRCLMQKCSAINLVEVPGIPA